MDRKVRVAIIGGGIGGLCLAAGLTKHDNLDVHVYESVPEYKDIGAGLALHMNAIKAMDLIGAQVKKAYFDKALTMADEAEQEMSTTVMLASGPNSGAVVAELGKAKGRRTVARSDLLAGLMDLVPEDRLHFGRRLETISESDNGTVDITFKDGSADICDVLLGCDGVHSMVRRYLLGEDHPATLPQNHDGWQIYRTLIPVEEAKKHIDEKWTRTVPIMCGPKGHINCMPLHRGKDVSAGVAVRGARKSGMLGTPPLRVEDFGRYSQDAQDIVNMVARDTSASWTVMDHDHAPFYNRGSIAMMGDAAHAAMPFAGNGAAQAIEDAAVLTELLGRITSRAQIPAALAAYDTVRRPRSQKVVEIARDFGRLYGFAIPEYGDDPVKMKAFFAEKAAFTNNADLAGQNQEAIRIFEELLTDTKHGLKTCGEDNAVGVMESVPSTPTVLLVAS